MGFEEIYRNYFKDVYYYVLGLSADTHISEEITQDTFFKAYRSIKKYDGKSSVTAWLFTIARNTYFTYCRKKKISYDECKKIAESMQGKIEIKPEETDNKFKKAIKNLNRKINLRLLLFFVGIIALAVAINVIHKWFQVNKLTEVERFSFYYSANPNSVLELKHEKRSGIFYGDELPSENPEDYLQLDYKVCVNNKSLSDVKVERVYLYSKSGKYADNILVNQARYGINFERGRNDFGYGDSWLYIGDLSEDEIDELMEDISLMLVFENSMFRSENITLHTDKCQYTYLVKTIDDYNRLLESYRDENVWKKSYETIYGGLGYVTYTDIYCSAAVGNFAVMDYDKYELIDGEAKYNYLFEIGGYEDYGLLVESEYELTNKEHRTDNVAENTYLVKKDTLEKITRLSDGEYKKIEELLKGK